MTIKYVQKVALLSIISAITLFSFGLDDSFADTNIEYKMLGGIPELKFTFRDGVETYVFPVFTMNENFVSDSGVSFSVQGIVQNSPLLHQAMDEAYKYRFSNNAFDYQMKYFDVDAKFLRDGESIITLDYKNCRIDNYQVETLDSNDYESYTKEIGFAVVDKIDFVCSGVNSEHEFEMPKSKFTDFGETGYSYLHDMKTIVTFEHDIGTEKIEFPVFDLVSAYQESSENVDVEFKVQGLLEYYPLLYRAIDNSRDIAGLTYASNEDFDALVEFTNGDKTIRGFDFRECIVSSAEIDTVTDKEEGFTGKSGFALVHTVGFTCSGLDGVNPNYDSLRGDLPTWKVRHLTNQYEEPLQNTSNGIDVFATITSGQGTETIEFSMFKQSEVLTSTVNVNNENGQKSVAAEKFTRKTTYPTIELRGIVGDYPMLYNYLDKNREIQNVAGTGIRDLLDIDIDIVSNGEVIRGFNYVNCRATNYDVNVNANSEESYMKEQFVLENIFNFECQGYHANNPAYDAMFDLEKANTTSSSDLRNTQKWDRGFYVE